MARDNDGLNGILPALITPLDAQGALNRASLEALLARLYAAGSHGVYVTGQTGEGLQLPAEVRRETLEIVLANTPPDRKVVAHVGAASTREAVGLAQHASRSGAHAISSLPPGSAFSFTEVQGYYRDLAAAASTPVLVYYFPEFSSSIRTIEDVLALCSIPNVVGLKFTDFDLYRLSLVQRAGYTIFNGRDEVLAAGLLMGAHGGIGSFYNLVPELFVSVYDHARAGRWNDARAVQDRINGLIRAVLGFPMIAAIKRLLTWSGIDCGYPMAPRRALTSAEEADLRSAVSASGFDPTAFLS